MKSPSPEAREACKRDVHLRKNPDDAAMKPVECGEIGVASITEAWGYYGPGGDGYADVCGGCITARASRRSGRVHEQPPKALP